MARNELTANEFRVSQRELVRSLIDEAATLRGQREAINGPRQLHDEITVSEAIELAANDARLYGHSIEVASDIQRRDSAMQQLADSLGVSLETLRQTYDRVREEHGPADRSGRVPIYGHTYPVKEQLKALGGRWDGKRKVWMVPREHAAEARKIVATAPRDVDPATIKLEASPASRRILLED